jgi:hypothetical protein
MVSVSLWIWALLYPAWSGQAGKYSSHVRRIMRQHAFAYAAVAADGFAKYVAEARQS